MGLFKVVKNRSKYNGVINNIRIYNNDIISDHKIYRDYYPKYVSRSTPVYIEIADCIDYDDYTKITVIGRSHYNMLRRKFNTKFSFKRKSSFRNYANKKVYHINGRAYRDNILKAKY